MSSNRRLSVSSVAFALFAALYLASSMGLAAVLLADDRGVANNPVLFIVYWGVLYGASIFLYAMGGAVRVERRVLLLAGLGFFATASALWSVSSATSVKYGASLLMNVPFCAWLVRRFDVPQLLRLVYWTILGMVVVSLVLSLAGADIVRYIDIHDRDDLLGNEPIRGLFNHKITAGLYAAFALLLSTVVKSKAVRAIAGAVLFFFVLRTGSASALALLAISIALVAIVRFAVASGMSTRRFAAIFAATALATTVAAVFLGGPVLEFLGRDPTLTGRTVLWGWGIDAFLQRPFLGWGYQAYFESIDAYWNLMSYVQFQNYDVPHFHNAYIQTAVDLGIFAVVAYVALLASAFSRSFDAYRAGKDVIHAQLAALILTILIAGVFINVFLVYNNFTTLLAFVAFLAAGTGRPKRNLAHE
ncbi:O-antigen ligase family protein [Lysobacter sp. KIS68-7]|uniref:O-antigen ligase family protein n=1 Tax=Lysobacter sp. KIS68-7 TaxID=2904252 RepID=UPI001E3A7D77|nr:O-antigen ligase family protein [Lysobacter sp. KIS68-7]UHQ18462.1 O-antigen ligase family protein [Lysobacter sp. KIS68-7]